MLAWQKIYDRWARKLIKEKMKYEEHANYLEEYIRADQRR